MLAEFYQLTLKSCASARLFYCANTNCRTRVKITPQANHAAFSDSLKMYQIDAYIIVGFIFYLLCSFILNSFSIELLLFNAFFIRKLSSREKGNFPENFPNKVEYFMPVFADKVFLLHLFFNSSISMASYILYPPILNFVL